MSEVKQSAQTIRSMFGRGIQTGNYDDLLALAKAWLEEHPEDEDELITNEWVLEELKGIHNVNNGATYIEIRKLFTIELVFECDVLHKLGMDFEEFYYPIPDIKTRGQLRQLIKLLKGAE